MAPQLVKMIERQLVFHPDHLVDASLQQGPIKRNTSAAYMAWCWDWALAAFVARGLVGTWLEFMQAMVFDFLPYSVETDFHASASGLTFPLAATLHFAFTYFGVSHGGQTFGMKVFGQVTSQQLAPLTWRESLRWAFTSMVAMSTAGLSYIWQDRLTGLDTTTREYFHWATLRGEAVVEASPVDVVAAAEQNHAEERFDKAA